MRTVDIGKYILRENGEIISWENIFKFENIETMEEVRKHIRECEGKHVQQVIFSSFHDALTQVCFGCKKIRSTIKIEKI